MIFRMSRLYLNRYELNYLFIIGRSFIHYKKHQCLIWMRNLQILLLYYIHNSLLHGYNEYNLTM
jgi:hypothetical protein